MSFNLPAIVTTIATQGIAGLTVLDFSAIPATLDDRKCPQLIPVAIGNGKVTRGTFGRQNAAWNGERSVAWVLYMAPIGSNRNIPANIWPSFAAALDTLLTGLTGITYADQVQLFAVEHGKFQTVGDPADKQYYGVNVTTTFIERK